MDRHNRRRMMSLGAFVHETGQHVAGWRYPDANTGAGTNFGEIYTTIVIIVIGLTYSASVALVKHYWKELP